MGKARSFRKRSSCKVENNLKAIKLKARKIEKERVQKERLRPDLVMSQIKRKFKLNSTVIYY